MKQSLKLATLVALGAATDLADQSVENIPDFPTADFDPNEDGLKTAAQGLGINVGAAINYWHIMPDFRDEKIVSIAKTNYDVITAESSCKMKPIAKGWETSKWNYAQCDYVAKFAKDNGMKFRGHAALWAKDPFYPDFVKWESQAWKIEDFMKRYIMNTVSRYKGQIFAWDVVNEAITDKSPYQVRTTAWSKVPDFICKAFKWANQADPDAELFYNDYGHSTFDNPWYKGRGDAVFNLIKDLKARGCPIHGVGFQLHEYIDFEPMIYSIGENLKRYDNIGIKVHFTEVDVQCKKVNGQCLPWDSKTIPMQTSTYYKLLERCIRAPNCELFDTWGISDKYSWLKEPANPLPFTKDYRKKGAYQAMKSLLENFDRNDPAVVERLKRQRQAQEKKALAAKTPSFEKTEDQEAFLY